MNTYSTLRTLCALWTWFMLIVGAIVGIAGGIQITKGDLTGIIYIIGAVALVLSAQIFTEVISLLIDIAQGLQQRNEPKTIEKLRK